MTENQRLALEKMLAEKEEWANVKPVEEKPKKHEKHEKSGLGHKAMEGLKSEAET